MNGVNDPSNVLVKATQVELISVYQIPICLGNKVQAVNAYERTMEDAQDALRSMASPGPITQMDAVILPSGRVYVLGVEALSKRAWLRNQAIAKLTPAEIDALGIEP